VGHRLEAPGEQAANLKIAEKKYVNKEQSGNPR
jgi:hypothetical protein